MEMGKGMGMDGEEIDQLYKAIKTAKGTGRGAAELFTSFEPTYRKHAKKLMPEQEVNELCRRQGQPARYPLDTEQPGQDVPT